MRRFLFWSTAMVLLAAATHIVTSVFFPRLEREDTVAALMSASETNTLTVLDDETKLKDILRGVPPDMAFAIFEKTIEMGIEPISIVKKVLKGANHQKNA